MYVACPPGAIFWLPLFTLPLDSGICCTILNGNGDSCVRKTLQRLLPLLWNVNEATMVEGHCTNNIPKEWNSYLRSLVGYYHTSAWSLLKAIEANTVEASTATDACSAQSCHTDMLASRQTASGASPAFVQSVCHSKKKSA